MIIQTTQIIRICNNCEHPEIEDYCKDGRFSRTHNGIGYSINGQRKSTKCSMCPIGKRCNRFVPKREVINETP